MFAHDLLVLGMVSQPPPSATPLSTHAVQIKLIELFQSYITVTKRRRWPFDDFYRLHWNVDLSCLQESDIFTDICSSNVCGFSFYLTLYIVP